MWLPLSPCCHMPRGRVAVAVEQMQGISPSPAGYSCSASRSTVSMELIHVVHERKVRWPRAFRRLVSFDGLDGWFLDSWLVVWSRYLAGAKALPGIWLVGHRTVRGGDWPGGRERAEFAWKIRGMHAWFQGLPATSDRENEGDRSRERSIQSVAGQDN